jgi:hypothetical protein
VTVGEALAEARYRAGLTVDEVSERTRIREAVIRGIEQDDYGACGGDLYVRGYVRAIAGAIGIDAQPLIREYDQWQVDAPEPPAETEAEAEAGGETAATVPAVTRPQPILAPAADPADFADFADAAETPARSRTQRRMTAIVVVALVVVGTAAGLIVSGLNHAPAKSAAASAAQRAKATQAATPSPAASVTKPTASAATPKPAKSVKPKPAARIRSLAVKLVEAFGPDGVADGDNPQVAQFAITRGAPSPWQSQWYVTPTFGMLKTGTGLLFDMGHRVTITSVTLELGPYAGADLQLRAGNTAATLASLRVAARANDADGTLRLRIRSPQAARYLLIWFTLLPPNGAGQYQASVSRVVVNGRP